MRSAPSPPVPSFTDSGTPLGLAAHPQEIEGLSRDIGVRLKSHVMRSGSCKSPDEKLDAGKVELGFGGGIGTLDALEGPNAEPFEGVAQLAAPTDRSSDLGRPDASGTNRARLVEFQPQYPRGAPESRPELNGGAGRLNGLELYSRVP